MIPKCRKLNPGLVHLKFQVYSFKVSYFHCDCAYLTNVKPIVQARFFTPCLYCTMTFYIYYYSSSKYSIKGLKRNGSKCYWMEKQIRVLSHPSCNEFFSVICSVWKTLTFVFSATVMSDLLYVHWFIGIHIRKTGYNKHIYGGFEV